MFLLRVGTEVRGESTGGDVTTTTDGTRVALDTGMSQLVNLKHTTWKRRNIFILFRESFHC